MRKSRYFLFLAFALQLGVGGAVFAAQPRTEQAARLSMPVAQHDANALMAAAGGFREAASRDFKSASTSFATRGGAQALARIDKALWEGVDNRIGWSYFFAVSIPTPIAAEGGSLVTFYSPWSDVFLVTQWQPDRGGVRIVDAEILLGDWVRRRGVPPLDAVPLWLRGGSHQPAAPAIAAADSIRALEQVFHGWRRGEWRTRLGGFTDTNQLTENRLAAANALGLAIEHAARFSADDANEEGLRLRIALGLLLRELIRGNTAAALDAVNDIPPIMKLVLADLPKREFRNLVPVAALVDAESASVFMVPAATPEYLLYFRFSRSGKDFVPARVDFVSYQRTYEWREAGSPGLAREVGR